MYRDRWDIYEQEKEFFTIATIKDELRKQCRLMIAALILLILISPLVYLPFRMFVIIPIAIFSEYEPSHLFNMVLLYIFAIGMLIFIIYMTIDAIKFIIAVKRNNFQITTDRVIKIIPLQLGGSDHSGKFIFEHSGSFTVHHEKLYYPWSRFYHLTGEYIVERTSVGDEFYVVSIYRHKALFIYSKKHFELKE